MSKRHLTITFTGPVTRGGLVEVPGLLVGDRVVGAVQLAPDDRRGWCADEYFARFCWHSDHLLVLGRDASSTEHDVFVILVQRDEPPPGGR